MEFSHSFPALIFTLHFSLLLFYRVAFGATFTFTNKCDHTVWPGVLANAGSPSLATTGFELRRGSSRSFTAPAGWSGRFWGRTGCTFSDGAGSCQTGDCGSGRAECAGSGAAPPATLAELTLGAGGLDFYDVSLVDGFNLPMLVEATGGSGMCVSTGCVADLDRACPPELRSGRGGGCRSACEAFGKPEYCCSGAYNSPSLCRPSIYSQLFKAACPRSYSYAYDDPTSTFTCSGADYTVTFCPSMPSQKSAQDPTPTLSTPGTTTTTNDGSQTGSGMGGSDSEPGSGLGLTGTDPEPEPGSGSEPVLTDKTWLAGLAMGDSTTLSCSSAFRFTFVVSAIVLIIFS